MPIHVLCADDSEDMRLLLDAAFSVDPGIEVEIVDCGEAALARAAEANFDAIVLDGVMPGISGIETCERLRASERTRTTPIVFLTALGDEDRAAMDAAGATGFIAKPFDPYTLAARLRKILAA